MKSVFPRILSLVVLAMAMTAVAHATPLVSSISITGTDVIDSTSIKFGASKVSTSGTGLLSDFHAGAVTSFNTYNSATAPDSLLYSVNSFDNTVQLHFRVFTSSYDAATGVYTFVGILREFANSTGSRKGSFLSSDDAITTFTPNSDGSFQMLTSVSSTPEPSSLILLGTGLVSAAGMVSRRRRRQIA